MANRCTTGGLCWHRRDELVTNAAAPNPSRAPISRRLLAALMSGGNAMASVSNCAFVN
jgi:hypothetical protein